MMRRTIQVSISIVLLAFLFKELLKMRDTEHSVRGRLSQGTSLDLGETQPLFPSYFTNAQGVFIYTRSWTVSQPKAAVFIAHGFVEHSGWYERIAREMNAARISVFAMDHQGHGASGGDRMFVAKFEHFADDFIEFVSRILRTQPSVRDVPRFLFGHSMGGCVVAHVAHRHPDFSGVILSNPMMKPHPDTTSPTIIALGGLLSRIVPRLGVSAVNLAFETRDETALEMYHRDPVRVHTFEMHVGAQLIAGMKFIHTDRVYKSFVFPVLAIQSTEDRVISPQGTRAFMERIASRDKTLVSCDGCYHGWMNDVPNRSAMMEKIIFWINDHI